MGWMSDMLCGLDARLTRDELEADADGAAKCDDDSDVDEAVIAPAAIAH